jgi:hypothetical protein
MTTHAYPTKTATRAVFALLAVSALWGCGDDDDAPAKKDAAQNEQDEHGEHGDHDHDAEDAGPAKKLTFFVSSDKSMTGDLGGLEGADARCEKLAKAISAEAKTWHAYLSVAHSAADGGKQVDARDRIGKGPWFNAKGVEVAKDLDALHARTGDAEVFIDEHGAKINGQWIGSPTPNEHDVLTGSNRDGTLFVDKTCNDWTSDDAAQTAIVGHADGLGPNQGTDGMLSFWNSAHENGGCNDTAPRGGAGRLYCFAVE